MHDQTQNPWKTLSSDLKYTNEWIELTEHKVITPGKSEGIYGVVSFKSYAIGIIPIDEAGNTWLVGQYRYPLNEYSWEIPMGGGKRDQDTLLSAQRELLEETGISAKDWTPLLKIHTSNSVTDETGYIFIAQDLSYGNPQPEDTEDLVVKKIPFTEAVNMVMDGKITDSLSIAGILKYAKMKNM